jgi:chaperonin GroES
MELNPPADKIVLRKIEEKQVTFAGIYIPDAVVEKANKGTVIAVGPGRTAKDGTIVPVAVTVGDNVMFSFNSGTPVKLNGEDLLIVAEDDILAIVD